MRVNDKGEWIDEYFFVHGVDQGTVDERLEQFAEAHWAYMGGFADRFLARGPTPSMDGTRHTGSAHVVEAATVELARQFAFEEPYWLAGVYASVSMTPVQSVRVETMRDRPSQNPGAASSLVLVRWPAQPGGSVGGPDGEVTRRLAEIDPLVFGGLLTSDDGTHSVGLVAAVDVELGQAAALVAGVGLPGSTTSVTSFRWRRGGRDQS